MNCPYSYNEENSKYLYCNISKNVCPLMKYCYKIEKYISSDNYSINCKYYQGKEEENMNKKQGDLKVRLVNNGVLFVELGDKYNQVIRVNNPYEYEPTYVNIVESNNNYYVKGFEPKPTKKEKVFEPTELIEKKEEK